MMQVSLVSLNDVSQFELRGVVEASQWAPAQPFITCSTKYASFSMEESLGMNLSGSKT